jgi:hypothetical protein
MASKLFQKPQELALLAVKAVLFVFILASPFVSFKSMMFLNTPFVKILMLVTIVIVCFYDFQLTLIATIAFMILVINMNTNILMKASDAKVDTFTVHQDASLSPLEQQFAEPTKIPGHIDQTQNIVCTNENKNDLNEDLIHHYIDDKIKPYDVYIQMMTSKDNLAKAQGSFL